MHPPQRKTPLSPVVQHTGAALAAEHWVVRRFLAAIGNPAVAITLWDGAEIIGNATPIARVHIHTRAALYRLLVNPQLHFGEDYCRGFIDVEGDLLEFCQIVSAAAWRSGIDGGIFGKYAPALFRRRRRNTLARARANIHCHYDLGNDFYRLWLDEEMIYTCAYFPDPDSTLEQAQIAKLRHIGRKLYLRPGATVVEAGCGWGALALYLARTYGITVKAYNISHEQITYARQRAQALGLAGSVEFIEDDYRAMRGQFDVFVSVGMLEHVGVEHYAELGAVMHNCLTSGGHGLIHSIGRDRPAAMNAWIDRYIFPGARPPALSEMTALFEPWGFSILDVENLRLHYAKTLTHWLTRYERAQDQVAAKFDRRFERAWRLYLNGSIAAFTSGAMQLFQIVFARSGVNVIPWTRADLYAPEIAAPPCRRVTY